MSNCVSLVANPTLNLMKYWMGYLMAGYDRDFLTYGPYFLLILTRFCNFLKCQHARPMCRVDGVILWHKVGFCFSIVGWCLRWGFNKRSFYSIAATNKCLSSVPVAVPIKFNWTEIAILSVSSHPPHPTPPGTLLPIHPGSWNLVCKLLLQI